MRLSLVLLSLVSCSALIGCSPGPTSSTDGNREPSSDSTTEVAAPPKCRTSDLEARVVDQQALVAQRSFVITLTSKARSDCRLQGYPAITLHEDDTALATEVEWIDGDQSPVTLDPGESASFDATFAVAETPLNSDCQTVNRLFITPPDDTQALRLPLEGAQVGTVCEQTTVRVSTVRTDATSAND